MKMQAKQNKVPKAHDQIFGIPVATCLFTTAILSGYNDD